MWLGRSLGLVLPNPYRPPGHVRSVIKRDVDLLTAPYVPQGVGIWDPDSHPGNILDLETEGVPGSLGTATVISYREPRIVMMVSERSISFLLDTGAIYLLLMELWGPTSHCPIVRVGGQSYNFTRPHHSIAFSGVSISLIPSWWCQPVPSPYWERIF